MRSADLYNEQCYSNIPLCVGGGQQVPLKIVFTEPF